MGDKQVQAEASKILTALKRSGVSETGVRNISVWEQTDKETGGTKVLASLSVKTELTHETLGPVVPSKPASIRLRKGSKERRSEYDHVAVFLPDPQVGFYRNRDNQLVSLHDPGAMASALAVTRELEPDTIINLGDGLDFTEFGTYLTEPWFAQTSNDAIQEYHNFLALQRRDCAPDATIVALAGNHEDRLRKTLLKFNSGVAYLRRAGDDQDVLSVNYLCRMDELGVDYVDGYPAADYQLREDLTVAHGTWTGQGSTSAAGKALQSRPGTSWIFGHNHTFDLKCRTVSVGGERRVYWAICPGTLARVDGTLPSYHSAMVSDKHVAYHEDWQQGMLVVRWNEGEDIVPELIPVDSEYAYTSQGKVSNERFKDWSVSK